MAQRRRVHFAGNVQGVGFRYTALSVARRYAVSGYVQNLPDGRVVVVAEGLGSELDNFFADLDATMQGHIQARQTESAPATAEFTGFDVRF